MTGPASEDERRHRAHLANMRQDLLAPAGAIIGYAEMLRDEAARFDLPGVVADLECILTAARTLYQLVDRLLTTADPPGRKAGAPFVTMQAGLRHDLCTPATSIKGYTEMLLEDSDGIA